MTQLQQGFTTGGMGSDPHFAWQQSSGPNVRFGWRIQLIDATPFPSNLARWNGMHMEGHARTWFTPKQKAELWERWKSGQWVADVGRALEERERRLRSWLSMEELLQRHAGELRRAVLQ
jgi:hypothetical protein